MVDAVSVGILDQATQEFLRALQADYPKILDFAKGLFFYLAGIQIVVSAIWMMFNGDPMEAAAKTIKLFFAIAFFYTLVVFGGSWMPQVINGFIDIGSHSSGISSLTPSSIMDQGTSIGFAIMDNFSHWGWITHPFGALLSCTILVAIVILYALLAAEMVIILVKSYVLITVSGLMFAFGANEAVRPMAINYFKAVIGIGLQLLVFYLIMGVGVSIGHNWAHLISQAAQNHELKPFLVVMAAVIVFYMVAKNVPPFVAGLSGVSGFRSYGDAAVGAAITAGSMVAGGAGMAARSAAGITQGGAQALKGGVQSAMMGGGAAKGAFSGGLSGAGKAAGAFAASAAGHSAASMGGAFKDSVMKNNPHMSFGQKFNAKMAERMAAKAAKGAASSGAAPGSDFTSNTVNK